MRIEIATRVRSFRAQYFSRKTVADHGGHWPYRTGDGRTMQANTAVAIQSCSFALILPSPILSCFQCFFVLNFPNLNQIKFQSRDELLRLQEKCSKATSEQLSFVLNMSMFGVTVYRKYHMIWVLVILQSACAYLEVFFFIVLTDCPSSLSNNGLVCLTDC